MIPRALGMITGTLMLLGGMLLGGVFAATEAVAQQPSGPEAVKAADNAFYAAFKRTEIKRSELTGTNMEVVLSVLEVPPGTVLPRHSHPGEEAFYVLEGAMSEIPGQPPQARVQGTGGINARGVPHAGYKIVGDKTLKLLTVHIVDKGKPVSTVVP